jgi:hypothetical protein
MRMPFTVPAAPYSGRFFGKNQRFATAYDYTQLADCV